MAHIAAFTRKARPVKFLTDYARQDDENTDDSLVIPEDLTALSADDLLALRQTAVDAFEAVYQGGEADLDEDGLATLSTLAEGIEALNAEVEVREAAAAERREQAAALASRVNPAEPESSEAPAEDEGDGEETEGEESDEDETSEDSTEVNAEDAEREDSLAASSARRRDLRVNLSGLRSRQGGHSQPRQETGTMRDVVMAAPDVPGFANGQGMDFTDMGRAVDARLTTFNKSAYEAAARSGRAMRQQFGIATIRKPFAEGLRIESNDPDHVEQVFARATDESRLPGGSLVASGGWCAPSETLYDLMETESRDGLFSLPEVNVPRGGIRFTQGPRFADLFADITGFSYTEEQDIDGTYGVDANGVGDGSEGSKPCYKVECPDFEEVRLGLEGLCITAGLLQQRGYPEVIARTIRGALVAHDHRIAGRKIAQIVAGSDAVSMAADQVGAAAPILTAIELHVEHYRTIHRLSRATTLEAVFPFWVHGAVRADLSRRLGVDLFDVPNSRITRWFTDRGVNPQFVYNWQDLSGDAADLTAYPTDISFLLYAAGTWVGGGSDVITLDTIYDSTLLGQNDYTALFTEEGTLVAKRGHDSRVVTVPICPDGATAAGVAIDCDGGAAAVDAG